MIFSIAHVPALDTLTIGLPMIPGKTLEERLTYRIKLILAEFRELNSNYYNVSHLTSVANSVDNELMQQKKYKLKIVDENLTFKPKINKKS